MTLKNKRPPLGGEGYCKIKPALSSAASVWHRHFSSSTLTSAQTHPVYFGQNFHGRSWPVSFSKLFHMAPWNSHHTTSAAFYLIFSKSNKSRRFCEYKIGAFGKWTMHNWNAEYNLLWGGQRGSVGELVHRVSTVELTIQWTSLYIKSHWSRTKEQLQIRSTKTPLWGASEGINERWYTFEPGVSAWPQLHCGKQGRATNAGNSDN